MSDKVIIFDTTLRDGEQSPGASMNAAEKLRLAVQLEKLGVDVIEAGFPAASEGDLEAVSQIAALLRREDRQLQVITSLHSVSDKEKKLKFQISSGV